PFDTGFIERNTAALGAEPQPLDAAAVAAAALQLEEEREVAVVMKAAERADGEARSPWLVADAFSLMPRPALGLPLLVDGERVEARIEWHEAGARVSLPGHDIDEGEHEIALAQGERGTWLALHRGRQTSVALFDPFAVDLDAAAGSGGVIKAPMHGKLIALFVAAGDAVVKGQRLAIVEAMKMEHVLVAPRDGTVSEIAAARRPLDCSATLAMTAGGGATPAARRPGIARPRRSGRKPARSLPTARRPYGRRSRRAA
ncbi:MAG: hypothetical protein B7Z14_02420, partial [Bosea sp. 32-68-6]